MSHWKTKSFTLEMTEMRKDGPSHPIYSKAAGQHGMGFR
jgi:hypothetical protein